MLTAQQLKDLTRELAKQMQWPEYMDVETAGRYIGRTGKAIRHLLEDGVLRNVSPDGKIQVSRRHLDEVFA